ncbi:hypothetical protein ASB83_14900 [Listeria monocytogenes]|nr:hypothetical protein [Listeria monocytogenes]
MTDGGLEKQVKQHEDRLRQHDKEIGRLNDVTLEMQKSMNEGLARVDESNRFLREQNTRQSEQNTEILQAVLNRNGESEKRDYDLKMQNNANMWKMIIGIGSSAGVVFAFVMELIKYFGGN